MFWNNFFSFLWHYTFFQDTRIRAIRRYWHVALGDLGKPALPDRNKPCACGRCCCWGAAVMIGGLEEQPCNTGTILRRPAQIKYLQVQYWHTVTTLGVGIGRSCREVLAIEEATLMHLVWCKWKMSLEGRHDHTSERVWQGCYCSRKLSALEVRFSKWF